ncbi:MAG: bifunctional diaminohydroxyphosphoribosylaminopyrimidine deaminase/5-amino-6-(5-phosphoribosylamino)uracil reductase RibD [Polyangiales bacterium]
MRPRPPSRLDAAMMARALREARKGRPSPNPHVGAVVARGGKIISVGHHARCGGPHAEVVALRRAGARARGATLYVTLEPCNHHGRTGPCTEVVITAGIARVVAGCADPTSHAARGRAKLHRAGIAFDLGLRRGECEASIADFTKLATTGLPHVTLKAAVTLDGKLATRKGDSKWITSLPARRHAHRLRAQADAVLVGVSTVLADDPELNVRLVRGPHPLRVVLDAELRMPPGSKLAKTSEQLRTLVYHAPEASPRRRRALLQRGVVLQEVSTEGEGRLRLRSVLADLGRRGVMRLLVEGGSRVHAAFLDQGLADRAAVFVAPRILGDAAAISLADGRPRARIAESLQLSHVRVRRFGDDVLIEGEIGPGRTHGPRRGR